MHQTLTFAEKESIIGLNLKGGDNMAEGLNQPSYTVLQLREGESFEDLSSELHNQGLQPVLLSDLRETEDPERIIKMGEEKGYNLQPGQFNVVCVRRLADLEQNTLAQLEGMLWACGINPSADLQARALGL